MRALLVVAHPLDNAFAKAAAARIRATLERRGIEVDMIDLYADDFDPRLTDAERRSYVTTPYDSRAVAGYVARLMLAEKLVFVFPQWWFNVPAILKGFFDRVLVPGVAFDHPSGGGPLIPRRQRLLSCASAMVLTASTRAMFRSKISPWKRGLEARKSPCAPLSLDHGAYIETMCGRIIQAAGPLRYQLVDGLDVPDSRLSNIPRRYKGAPSQELFVIRQNHKTGERSLDLLKWGLVPSWSGDPKGAPKPINAMTETVRSKPMFRDAYRKRRYIVPVEGFFEWQATKVGKQPYAIAMKNGAPFGLAGLWENWKDPASGDWVRTFTIITVPSNELIARIHDRMPAILRPADYERWLGSEPDPHDLLITFPSEPMKMWPISKRVNNPRNDDEDLLAEVDLAAAS